ncbi:MAG TPA: DUF4424 family protein [Prolixibacteraceae bacterium]|nr:DUF4424 family protein [Prolixibacteraceae bacterium]
MKRFKFAIVILTIICLQTNLFADIAPNPIKAKTISPKDQTSIRMESEKVIIDLYNDSSVVKCLFNMKNLGEQEKLQICFPEMSFYHYRIKSKADEVNRFEVKENGKAIKIDFSDSLRYDKGYRKKVELYQIKEEWYLWDSEFQKGESKTIEVQYSLPFGMLYKSNKRFFTYLLSTGAKWKGTIGKAEIIINLKDIVKDSIISKSPADCKISDKQFIWTFRDFEPSADNDIKVIYNSDKILYKGKKPISPAFMVNGEIKKDFEFDKISPTDIASIEIIKNPENNKNHKSPNGIVKIYTKEFVMAKFERMIKAKTKRKITLPEFDEFKENYCLMINEKEVDISQIINIEKKSIDKLEIISTKDEKNKIMIELKK